MNLRAWLQLFRAQTAPATLLLVLVPYLTNAPLFDIKTLILAFYCVLIHYFSFGHNSLMDTAMGYDLEDPSKSHHPLVSGRIKLSTAHKVIHFGQIVLTFVAAYISYVFSPSLGYAMMAFSIFLVCGYSYNCGLSKESLLGFLPISLCFTSLGAWAWLLSHSVIDPLGWLLITYFFMTIFFQISWSGHLKELELRERSNILARMGATLDVTWKGEKVFKPGLAGVYGGVIKFINVPILGALILAERFDICRLLWFGAMILLTSHYLFKLIKPRRYVREKELMAMSCMEIVTIYTPIPLVLGWLEASILMFVGVAYFFAMNRLLWQKPYPRV